MFKYETHLHTKESSRCGQSPAEIMVKKAKEDGYTGIIVTDHFIGGCSSYATNDMTWEEKVFCQVKGYKAAKKVGDEIGLQVFFGFEKDFYEICHLLTYGLDEEWLLRNPQIMELSMDEYCDKVHEDGGFIVHAHPFRCLNRTVFLEPDKVDAIEVYNSCNKDEANRRGVLYAEMLDLPKAAGSDIHIESFSKRNGIETEEEIKSCLDYLNVLKSGNYKLFEKINE